MMLALVITLFIVYGNVLAVQGRQYTIDIHGPERLSPGLTDLNVSCIPPNIAGLMQIVVINLYKNNTDTGHTQQKIASVTFDPVASLNRVSWTDPLYLNRSEVHISGSVSPMSTAHLNISIEGKYTQCHDIAEYECEMRALDMNFTAIFSSPSAVKNTAMKDPVTPSMIQPLSVVPIYGSHGQIYVYNSGQRVKLTCTGSVGNPPKMHRWCYRQSGQQHFQIYSRTSDIKQDDFLSLTNCDYIRSSTLTYTITANDSVTTFICEDQTNQLCGEGLFSANVTIRNQFQPMSIVSGSGVNGQKNKYEVGENIKILCTGNVGIPPMLHTWCYKNDANGSYQDYPYHKHINQQKSLLISGYSYIRTSALDYTVTNFDTDTVFTCGTNLHCGMDTNSPNITINNHNQPLQQTNEYMKTQLAAVRAEFKTELQTQIAAARADINTELQTQIAAARADFNTELHTNEQKQNQSLEQTNEYMKTQLSAARSDFNTEIHNVEQKLTKSVMFLSNNLTAYPLSVHTGQIIPFNNAVVNTGNGFSTSIYKFTAPVAGSYMFVVTLKSISANVWYQYYIMKNNQPMQYYYIYSNNNGFYPTKVMYLTLSVGDTVWLRSNSNQQLGCYSPQGHCTFSGQLITPS